MQDSSKTASWLFIFRIVLKAALLFLLFNLIFALVYPMDQLGSLTLYNVLFPGRERLPYGENSSESYNLSLYNLPAMITSHEIVQEKPADEFKVIFIGDSGTWGWYLENEDTLAGQINAENLETASGLHIRAYNLGYPVMSLTKDLMILDMVMQFDPDLIVWPVTLESFPQQKQLFSPIVQNNPERIRWLSETYDLSLNLKDAQLQDSDFINRTIVGQRRNIADLFRLQFYGLSWAATGIDQAIPDEIPLRRSDFEPDLSWQSFEEPVIFREEDLAFEILEAGHAMVRDVPILLINEPMFISNGLNSDLRYNSFYPRWAYDQYREIIENKARKNGWVYVDLWDLIDPQEFTDTPVHLTPEGSRITAERIAEEIINIANSN